MLLDRIGPPGRCSGCWPHDGEVAGGAVADLDLMISGDRFYLFYHPYARARALMARPWSARCYGVARQRDGSRQNSTGVSGVLSLRHFGLAGSPLARGCRRIWRGEVLVYWFRRRDTARPDRAAWAVQWLQVAGGAVSELRFNDFQAPPLLSFVTLTRAREGQAVVCPLLRGSSPTRWVAPKQHWGLGRAFSPAFRAGGIPLGAGVPKNLARRSFGLLVSAARYCSTGSGRLGGAVAAGRRRCRLRIEI